MPVVINEIEVSMEAEGPQPPGSSASQPPPAMTPLEIAELLDRRARNELRLFAH